MVYMLLTSGVVGMKFKKEMKMAQFLLVNYGAGQEQSFFGCVTPSTCADMEIGSLQSSSGWSNPSCNPNSVIAALATFFGTSGNSTY